MAINKKLISALFLILSNTMAFCQNGVSIGITGEIGKPNLFTRYSNNAIGLAGVSLSNSASVGVYLEMKLNRKLGIGSSISYYRLPVNISDKLGNNIFKEAYTYLSVSPYALYSIHKIIDICAVINFRPLIKATGEIITPTSTSLIYYGPVIRVKPNKFVDLSIGYDIGSRPFGSNFIGSDITYFSYNSYYVGLRVKFANLKNRSGGDFYKK